MDTGHDLPFYLGRDGVRPLENFSEYIWGNSSEPPTHQAG